MTSGACCASEASVPGFVVAKPGELLPVLTESRELGALSQPVVLTEVGQASLKGLPFANLVVGPQQVGQTSALWTASSAKRS